MWSNSKFPADLVTFSEEIFNGKPCAVFFATFREEPDDLFSFGYIKNVTELVILLEKPITLLLPF